VVPLADEGQDGGMPRESWQMSGGLRAVTAAGGMSYGIGPLWKRRWLRGLPPVRSGFEEMDLAITHAAAGAPP
jgi:hypothetical protein